MSELSKDEVAALIEDVGLDGIVEPEELLPLEALSTIRARVEELTRERDRETQGVSGRMAGPNEAVDDGFMDGTY